MFHMRLIVTTITSLVFWERPKKKALQNLVFHKMIRMLLIFTLLVLKFLGNISRHFLEIHEKRVTRELWVMGTIMPALKIPLAFKRKIKEKY